MALEVGINGFGRFGLHLLKYLYGLDYKDIGPEVHNCTDYSTVFIKEAIKSLNDNFYLQGYFDNENSVNRFYDLADFISSKN